MYLVNEDPDLFLPEEVYLNYCINLLIYILKIEMKLKLK